MTERWQEELRKLRAVRPTADLDTRIAEGPRPEPPAPASRRVVAAVTAFALFAAAGAFAFIVLREDGSNGAVVGGGEDPRLVLSLVSTDEAPTATLRYGDRRVDVVTEGYEWCEVDSDQCAGMIADFAFYPPTSEYLVVPPGTPIEVSGDGTVGAVRVTDPEDRPIPGVSELVVPHANGRYAFGFTGVFDRGEGFFFFGVQALDAPSSAPDVLLVDCSASIARTDTAIVRTQADGLHVATADTEGFEGFEIVTPEGTPPELFSGVRGAQDGSEGWPIAPGRWEIGCSYSGKPVEAGDQTISFELVDPDDHWVPWELSCNDAAETSFTTTIPSSVPHEEAAAHLLGGLVDGDRIRGAGYGAEQWLPGVTYVVDRGGLAIARVVLSPLETYGADFSACADSGIELTLPADGGQVVPDVLVVRCEGLGPAVDTPTVRLQADGLHIEASTVADAIAVAIDSDSGEIESFVVVEFDTVTEDLLLDLPPGTYWIGCRVPNEQGQIEGGHEEFPDAYVEVEVLPADG